MIGIYKITSPLNKVYIGQAINIDKRWEQYINPNSSLLYVDVAKINKKQRMDLNGNMLQSLYFHNIYIHGR